MPKPSSVPDNTPKIAAEPADESMAHEVMEYQSAYPYAMTGGWTDPRGGGLNAQYGAGVLTNGIQWNDNGSVWDQNMMRETLSMECD